LFNVLLSFFFELLEFGVVLECGFFKVSGFNVEIGFELVYFSTVDFFHAHELIFESLIFDDDILILVKKIVDLELKLTDGDIFPTELILEFDEFIFEFDSHLTLIIKIIFILFFGLLELFSLILKHELNLVVALVFVGIV
jgi:hypothetical protein